MRSIVILGSALVSTAAAAEVPAPAAPAAPDPNERICVVRAQIGSRLGSRRICATRAEWAAERRDTREAIAAGQTNQINPQDMDAAERAKEFGRYFVVPR